MSKATTVYNSGLTPENLISFDSVDGLTRIVRFGASLRNLVDPAVV